MKSTKSLSQANEKQIKDQIEHNLSLLQINRNRTTLKWLFDGTPLAVMASTTISTFAGWYSRSGVDFLYLTWGLIIVASALFTRSLFEQYPQILLAIWRRKILCFKPERTMPADKFSSRPVEKMFLDLVQTAQERMNSTFGIVCGILGTIVVGWMIWLLDQEVLGKIIANIRNPFSVYGTILLMRLTFLMAGFVGGTIGWRIVIIANMVSELGRKFDFDLQINHPDGCGGLRPIGDLCLKLAYVVSALPLLLGLWLVLLNFVDIRFLRVALENIEPLSSTIVFLTIPVAALCLFSFFIPLGSVHTAMLRAQSRLQVELDSISQEIHQLSTSLLTKANDLAPQRGTSLEEKIEFLKRVYARNSQIPTWPYRGTHIWGLMSTQVVPSLGVISSIVGLIRGFGK